MKLRHHLPGSAKDVIYSVAGILVSAFALKRLLIPNHFFDGGVTGVSLLINELYHEKYHTDIIAWVIVVLNIPFIIAGRYHINKKFAVKTLACVVGLGLCLTFMDDVAITQDKLLASLFGGLFMGVGIGLAMRGGCSIDGIEVLALYTLKHSSFTISEIILGLNIIIFVIAVVILGPETALYSVLTYYVASKAITYVIEGLEEYTGITIISAHSEEIKEKLVMKLGRGITIYKGERGFLKHNFEYSEPCDIVFTVVTRLEVRRLKNLVHSIDPKAFMFTNTIREAAGGVLKHRKGH